MRLIQKVILLLVLSFLCNSVFADWVLLSENEFATQYIDPSTLKREGKFRRLWELNDYKTRQPEGHHSVRSKKIYDCQGERWKYLSITAFSEPYGKGSTIYSSDDEDVNWRLIPPRTPAAIALERICKK